MPGIEALLWCILQEIRILVCFDWIAAIGYWSLLRSWCRGSRSQGQRLWKTRSYRLLLPFRGDYGAENIQYRLFEYLFFFLADLTDFLWNFRLFRGILWILRRKVSFFPRFGYPGILVLGRLWRGLRRACRRTYGGLICVNSCFGFFV